MSDFRRVTDDFTTAPQISIDDLREAKRLGFKTVINNRPDGEAPDQPTNAQMRDAAAALDLAYHHIPVVGGPTPDQVKLTREVLAIFDGPILAFCRSGTRSIVTWALAQAASGERTPDELIALGRNAGYDLSGVLGG